MSATQLFDYLVRLADNALVLGHRVSEWIGRAPLLEEELALGNLGLDLIGQARMLYAYAGEVEGNGRDEDHLAYFRDQGDWRNVLLVERPNGDFAATMLRHLFFAAYAAPLYAALTKSTDSRLADIAAKAVKEMTYHIRHAGEWVVRLGDGTPESHERAQAALDDLWTYTGELFERDAVEDALIAAGVAADPRALKQEWDATIAEILERATLQSPANGWMQSGGRRGIHSEELSHMLAVMQSLPRAMPGAVW
ncbi:1,2-phenylacetyl-CoA epoxidase subunit PaaC [Ferrovibrio sp.]|uniref:1,2-phenylacetyl-CoA epoxidase subunit PaaC n=1 Tax=Ferrovibrio sp. TaxID=1917215 RepID=UPI00311E01A0